jgi:hypothetical protein
MTETTNCPTCGRIVSNIFEHVDMECQNWPDREEDNSCVTYRDFSIEPHDHAGWQWVHTDYDGPEDNRAGTETTWVGCLRAIDEFLDS